MKKDRIKDAHVGVAIALAMLLPAGAFADHSAVMTSMSGSENAAVHAETGAAMTAAGMTHADCTIAVNLTVGSRGDEVMCLQHALIDAGLLSIGTPTGYFGSHTKSALMQWQEKNGVPGTGFFGSLSRTAFSATADKHDDNASSGATTMAAHPKLDVSDWPAKPSVSMTTTDDPHGGWNVHIMTENFTLAPEHVNQASVPNEGHMHLLIDGTKYARVYSNWFNIPASAASAPGQHIIRVTLNANDHSELAQNGISIEATTTVTVAPPAAAMSSSTVSSTTHM